MSDGLVPLISVFYISIICVQPSIGLTIFFLFLAVFKPDFILEV